MAISQSEKQINSTQAQWVNNCVIIKDLKISNYWSSSHNNEEAPFSWFYPKKQVRRKEKEKKLRLKQEKVVKIIKIKHNKAMWLVLEKNGKCW